MSEPVIPPLKPIQSAHLAATAHDRTSNTLFVQFHDQSVYGYLGVLEGTYQALLTDKSAGQFFNQRIKGKYQSAKLRAAPPKQKAQPA